MKTFFGHDENLWNEWSGLHYILIRLAVESHSHDPPLYETSNQETAAGGGGEHSGVTQEALPEGINWKETHMEISSHL